jgi:predicted metal-dependent peptidase
MIRQDNKHEKVLQNILAKLPQEISDFASKNVFFIFSQGSKKIMAEYFNLRAGLLGKYRFLVILRPNLWGKSPEIIKGVIAHEVAHAFLSHENPAGDNPEIPELEANKLASKWLGRNILYRGRRVGIFPMP